MRGGVSARENFGPEMNLNMKTEDQLIAIAQACGWTCVGRGSPAYQLHHGPGVICGIPPKSCYGIVPPYVSDLNAMSKAEATLGREGQSYEYWQNLCACCGVAWDGNAQWEAVFATAEQRAEAFLRTIGKWI